jgi:hypothetical protein
LNKPGRMVGVGYAKRVFQQDVHRPVVAALDGPTTEFRQLF